MDRCPTTIETLHAAYEDAWAAYNANDDQRTRTTDTAIQFRCHQAMSGLSDQTDTLRLAILRRFPTCHADLLLVAAHVSESAGLVNDREHKDADLNDALEEATENMVTFIARTFAPEVFGDQISNSLRLYGERVDARNRKETANA